MHAHLPRPAFMYEFLLLRSMLSASLPWKAQQNLAAFSAALQIWAHSWPPQWTRRSDLRQTRVCMQPILETLGRACSTYGRRNLRMLYDALSTLADMVGRPLAQPDCIQLFMPPLLQRWQTTEDTDRELLPLLEVFTTIAQALGTPLTPALFLFCVMGLIEIGLY